MLHVTTTGPGRPAGTHMPILQTPPRFILVAHDTIGKAQPPIRSSLGIATSPRLSQAEAVSEH